MCFVELGQTTRKSGAGVSGADLSAAAKNPSIPQEESWPIYIVLPRHFCGVGGRCREIGGQRGPPYRVNRINLRICADIAYPSVLSRLYCSTLSRIALVCSGVLPQQEPTMR